MWFVKWTLSIMALPVSAMPIWGGGFIGTHHISKSSNCVKLMIILDKSENAQVGLLKVKNIKLVLTNNFFLIMAMLTEKICPRKSNHSPYISKLYF